MHRRWPLWRQNNLNEGAENERERESRGEASSSMCLTFWMMQTIIITRHCFLHMNSCFVWEGWSVSDIPDSHRRRRPQLHTARLIYPTIISLAQTDSFYRDRCTGSRHVGVSAAPDGPIRKPLTHRDIWEPWTPPTHGPWLLISQPSWIHLWWSL